MKKLLVVVDYQNDFVSGSLGNEAAKNIEEYIASLMEEYKKNDDDILLTLDTHQEDYLDTYEGKHLPVVHCIENTEGHELYGKIKDLADGYPKLRKPTFPSLELGNYLKETDYKEVTVVGVVTDICVISNAIMIKAALPNASITIDTKGCASNDPVQEKKALDVMKNSLQINVI